MLGLNVMFLMTRHGCLDEDMKGRLTGNLWNYLIVFFVGRERRANS